MTGRRVAWLLTATAGVLAGAASASGPATLLVYPQYPMVTHQAPGLNSLRALRLGRVEAPAPPPPPPVREAQDMRAVTAAPPPPPQLPSRVLWNFTSAADVSDWVESSDGTERQAGMSTGAFKLQKTATFQRAVMFSLLNPQPNGAGFVGFYSEGNWDLSPYNALWVTCRAQGQGHRYKVYMKNTSGQRSGGAYESYFEMPDNEWRTVALPLSSFKYYFRGRLVPDAPPINTGAISRIGLQIYGGVYQAEQQRGVSSLEIDSIVAVSV